MGGESCSIYKEAIMNVINKIYRDLNLNKVGWSEMLIAMYPILASYQYGPVPFSLLVLLVVIFILYKRYGMLRSLKNKWFMIMATYVIIHDIFLIFFMGFSTPSFYINSLIALIISLTAVFLISPYLN